jgi:hypothetical protein
MKNISQKIDIYPLEKPMPQYIIMIPQNPSRVLRYWCYAANAHMCWEGAFANSGNALSAQPVNTVRNISYVR